MSAPSAALAAVNLLQNGDLSATSGTTPACWRLSGYGTNSFTWTHTTDAHSQSYAERLDVTGFASGDRKLLSVEDAGTCAPAVTPGQRYGVSAWYKVARASATAPKFFAFYRSSSGKWSRWTDSPTVGSSSTWAAAKWTTPAVPSGATNIAVGMGLSGVGSVTMDDFRLWPLYSCPTPGPQKTWAAPGTRPLSDGRAAACVVHRPETRLENTTYNNYVPTDAQLKAFHSAIDDSGSPADQDVPTRVYVTGRPGLSKPSTDDLIQWAAHKWGIPEDWIRADMAVESWWVQTDLGDRATVASNWYTLYPQRARISGTSDVYQSMGISQVKWIPDGSDETGTEPLRWKSTAFALDYYAAKIRYYYDGDCGWCGSGYSAGQAWNSVGGWYEPSPWGNSNQESYIGQVKSDLANRVWEQPGFAHAAPASPLGRPAASQRTSRTRHAVVRRIRTRAASRSVWPARSGRG
jgi:hypothetical protein